MNIQTALSFERAKRAERQVLSDPKVHAVRADEGVVVVTLKRGFEFSDGAAVGCFKSFTAALSHVKQVQAAPAACAHCTCYGEALCHARA